MKEIDDTKWLVRILLPGGQATDLTTDLFLIERRSNYAFPMSFEVDRGTTFRRWHINEDDIPLKYVKNPYEESLKQWCEDVIPDGLSWSCHAGNTWRKQEIDCF